MRSLRPTSLAFASVILLAACSSTPTTQENVMQNAVGDQGAVNVDANGAMHVTTSDGSYTAGGNQMPSDWPTDVAVYAGATVAYSASANPETGAPAQAIVLTTSDSTTAVATFYKTRLAQDGWVLSTTMDGTDMTIFSATKDTRTLSMLIAGSDGQTTITMGIEKKAAQ